MPVAFPVAALVLPKLLPLCPLGVLGILRLGLDMPVFIESCCETLVEPVVLVDAVSAVLLDLAVDSLDDEFGVAASGVGDLELLLLNTLNTLPTPSLKLPLLLLLLRDESSSSDTSSNGPHPPSATASIILALLLRCSTVHIMVHGERKERK